jgi:hypothetical protein
MSPSSRVAACQCLVSRPTSQPRPCPARIVVEWRAAHRYARNAWTAACRLV